MTHSLLTGMNEAQQAATTHTDGPALVLAGPGSGKTRVITHRVAHLIQACNIAPWAILAITFTNKAAAEMRERVSHLLTERQAHATTLTTFHSFGARLLRRYGDCLGLPPGYTILDSSDQKRAMKEALKRAEIDPKQLAPARALNAISHAKNALITATDFSSRADNFFERQLAKAYKQYQHILDNQHAVDFDDLIMKSVHLLQQYPQVAQERLKHFEFIMIDECQDTNRAQWTLARLLTCGHQNIMATGDPDQSIYGWRGADIQNILAFEDAYPDCTTYRLEQNYRSTEYILQAADCLIRNNSQRKHKRLYGNQGDGQPVMIQRCDDEQHEAQAVVDHFKARRQAGFEWGDCAVMYRNNAMSRNIEDALRNAGIPYQMVRGTAFYDRKEIRDAMAYLRVIANPTDDVGLLRVINTPARGISKATQNTLAAYAQSIAQPLGHLLHDPSVLPDDLLNSRAVKAVHRFAELLNGWRHQIGEGGFLGTEQTSALLHTPQLGDVLENVLETSGLLNYYEAEDLNDPTQERVNNLQQLVSAMSEYESEVDALSEADDPFGDMPFNEDPFGDTPIGSDNTFSLANKLIGFLERASLASDTDALEETGGAVKLLTLHAAKGLEFPACAIIGLEEGLLPSNKPAISSAAQQEELEEERRLFFVGMTRAQKNLLITYAKRRMLWGKTEITSPSSFLQELPPEPSVVIKDLTGINALAGWNPSSVTQPPRNNKYNLTIGSRVHHKEFGPGKVHKIMVMGAHTRAIIDFDYVGKKTLILEYAKLETLG